MRKFLANGVNLHYQQQGEGTDVVLVHGVTSDLSYWLLTVVPRLVERHRVTIYDLRGHGYSDVPSNGYTSQDMVDDLRGLMDGLGIERAHVLGHSFGGAIALHFAVCCPERVRSLVIADAGVPALRHHVSIAQWPMYRELQKLVEPYGARLPDDPDSWDPSEVLLEAFKLPTVIGLRKGLPRQERRIRRLAERTTCFADLRATDGITEEQICAVTAPTLALYSEQSPFLGIARYLEAHLPHCRALIQSGGDHFLPAVEPETLGDLVLEYLDSVDRAGGGPPAPLLESHSGPSGSQPQEKPIHTTEQVRQVIEGLRTSVAAFAALACSLESRLLERLTEPGSPAELGAATGVPAELVERTLDVLGALGLVRREGDRFVAKPGLLPLLEAPARDDLLANLRTAYFESWEAIRSARQGAWAPGWRHTDPEILHAYGATSTTPVRLSIDRALPLLGDLEARLGAPAAAFLDVGTGAGSVAIELCRLFPNLSAVGIEPQEAILAEARRSVAAAGLDERITLRGQRVEELTDCDAFDLAYFPPLFMPRDVVARGLRAVWRALRPGGWIWLSAMSVPGTDLSAAVSRWVNVLWGGDALFPGEIAEMAREAGFEAVLVGGLPGSSLKGIAGRRPA